MKRLLITMPSLLLMVFGLGVLWAQGEESTNNLPTGEQVKEDQENLPAPEPLTKKDFVKSDCKGYWEYDRELPTIEISEFMAKRDESVQHKLVLLLNFTYKFTDRQGVETNMTAPTVIRRGKDLNYTRLTNYLWANKDKEPMDLLESVRPVVKKKDRTELYPDIFFCAKFDEEHNNTTSKPAFRLPFAISTDSKAFEKRSIQRRTN